MMTVMIRGCLAAACVTALVGNLTAQPPNRPGPGGFGGRMQASGANKLMMLRSPEVQEEIALTAEQKEQLIDWSESFREKMQEKTKDIPRQDFRKRMEIIAELSKEGEKELSQMLKPEQLKRLEQISVQSQGNRALQNPEIQEKLGITAEQKEKLREISSESGKAMRELFGGGRPDPQKFQEIREKMQALQKKIGEQMQNVLTSEQKAKWKELTGEPFDTSKLFQGRPRPARPNNND